MSGDLEGRTEQATPRRRLEARREGRVARSPDVVAAIVLLAAALTLHWFAAGSNSALQNGLSNQLSAARVDSTESESEFQSRMVDRLCGMLLAGIQLSWPVWVAAVASAVLANLLQTGPIWAPAAIRPDLNRLNAVSGLQQILFSGLVRRGCGLLLRVLILSGVLMLWFSSRMNSLWFYDVTPAGQPPITDSSALLGRQLIQLDAPWIELLGVAGATLLAIGILDFAYRRWRLEQSLRMTPEEVREEKRLSETAPEIRRARRSRRQQPHHSTPLKTAKPDLVLLGDDGRAVAIRYDERTMTAPQITACCDSLEALASLLHVPLDQLPIQRDDSLARRLSERQADYVPPADYASVARWLAER